jgi:hypothetical protein
METTPVVHNVATIIPRHPQNIEHYQAHNPMNNASIIADKNARRLFAAIDGRKSMVQLATGLKMEPQTAIDALHYLLQHKRIQIYTSEGERIHHLPFNTPLT